MEDYKNKAGMHGFFVLALPVQQRNEVTQISTRKSIIEHENRRGVEEGRLMG